MLNCVALIVVPGGIGRSLDDAALSLMLFQAHSVPVIGIVANKVFQDKFDKVARGLSTGLQRQGTRLLGAIPFEPELSYPTVEQIREELGARVLCGEEAVGRTVASTLIAAMTAQNVLAYLQPNSLVITPGDRVDNILLAISADMTSEKGSTSIAGIILTGGFIPPMAVMPMLKKSGLPVLLCKEDTYGVSARISQQVFKISPGDTEKIEAAQRVVRERVDVETILSKLRGD